MESVLQNINKLNRSLEGVIAVGIAVLSEIRKSDYTRSATNLVRSKDCGLNSKMSWRGPKTLKRTRISKALLETSHDDERQMLIVINETVIFSSLYLPSAPLSGRITRTAPHTSSCVSFSRTDLRYANHKRRNQMQQNFRSSISRIYHSPDACDESMHASEDVWWRSRRLHGFDVRLRGGVYAACVNTSSDKEEGIRGSCMCSSSSSSPLAA